MCPIAVTSKSCIVRDLRCGLVKTSPASVVLRCKFASIAFCHHAYNMLSNLHSETATFFLTLLYMAHSDAALPPVSHHHAACMTQYRLLRRRQLLYMQFVQIPSQQVLVVCDDLDLPTGKTRLRAKGGHGGHNGLRSIMQHLKGSQEFPRLKIGIGRPAGQLPVASFVLQASHTSLCQRHVLYSIYVLHSV